MEMEIVGHMDLPDAGQSRSTGSARQGLQNAAGALRFYGSATFTAPSPQLLNKTVRISFHAKPRTKARRAFM